MSGESDPSRNSKVWAILHGETRIHNGASRETLCGVVQPEVRRCKSAELSQEVEGTVQFERVPESRWDRAGIVSEPYQNSARTVPEPCGLRMKRALAQDR